MTDDERQLRDLVSTWMRATREGDSQTVLGLMTDDVVFLVPGHPPFGKSAFAEAAKQQQQNGIRFDGSSQIEELQIVGDWAFIRSKLTVQTTHDDGGDVARRSGYTLTIFRKTDGRWRLARDANLLLPDDGQTATS